MESTGRGKRGAVPDFASGTARLLFSGVRCRGRLCSTRP
jgi:hypothetical protein